LLNFKKRTTFATASDLAVENCEHKQASPAIYCEHEASKPTKQALYHHCTNNTAQMLSNVVEQKIIVQITFAPADAFYFYFLNATISKGEGKQRQSTVWSKRRENPSSKVKRQPYRSKGEQPQHNM